MRPRIDHFMYVAQDLEAASRELAALTGVRPAPGGRHAGMGTHNALLGLGDRQYLEILAPIPGDPRATQPGGLLAGLGEPRLFMWAVATDDLDALARTASRRGYEPGAVIDMSRELPEGGVLHWRLSVGGADVAGSVVPFGIQWQGPPHPAETAPAGCTLAALRAEHPEPERIRSALAALGVELEVEEAEAPALVIEVDTPRGPVELR